MTGRPTLPERVAERVSAMLAGPTHDRRGFLRRAALVGTALAVNPFDFVLRPGTAYASVCGPENECSQGWSAFCCTINGGANTCPPGSYVAGWWKVADSAFCRGEDRFIVDCNRSPEADCTCRCASGDCDRRRSCCNNFRYGQCNQQIAGTTEVVCRLVICTPPWEYDPACTATVRTDERTREHSSSCLPGPWPSVIEIAYQDLGLSGSALGKPTADEVDGPRGGRWRSYAQGAITSVEAFGLHVVLGDAGVRYAGLGGPGSALGYAIAEPADLGDGRGTVAAFEAGEIWSTPETGAWEVVGPIRDRYREEGGPAGWLGYPTSGGEPAPGGRERSTFEAGWMLAHDPSTGEVRVFPADVVLPDSPGEWPPTAEVIRWDGTDRFATAARVALEVFPDGAPIALLARGDAFPDALAGGVWAGREGGPLLLCASSALPRVTAQELARLAPERVVLLGGRGAIGDEVRDAVVDLLPDAAVDRVGGVDRYATAALVSREAFPDASAADAAVPQVLVATGQDFADALAGAPVAARAGGPILLVQPGDLPDASRAELQRLAPDEVVVLGGTAAVGDEVGRAAGRAAGGADLARRAGASRFETAVEVVAAAFDEAGTVLVATGEGFADGLAAGPAAIALDAPLLLVARDAIPDAVLQLLRRFAPRRIVVIGGEAVVTASLAARLAGLPVPDSTGP